MTVYYQDGDVTLHHGDCIAIIAGLPDNSIDAIVTDPPYGLGFMGKAWDALPPGEPWARECLRVLKPGGHVLAFGGTRTWHRLAVAIEDAGFELRDSIAWLYGSGFPKSLDVSKAIDKLDASVERRGRNLEFTAWMRSTGITSAQINEATQTNMGGHYLTDAAQPAVATADLFDKLRPYLPAVPDRIEELVAQRTVESANFKARGVVTEAAGESDSMSGGRVNVIDHGIPQTDAAQQWAGWGTALKPAFEPVVVGRKPLDGTVAANVLAHGVGALNIDACRTGGAERPVMVRTATTVAASSMSGVSTGATSNGETTTRGRWPTNVAIADDECPDCIVDQLGEHARFFPTFKYQAKAPSKERPKVDGVAHPTVKPLDLMRWLVRLVTPPGGTVLEPFLGSGTTAEACRLEGFRCIGIERDETYLPLTMARLGVRRREDIPPWELDDAA